MSNLLKAWEVFKNSPMNDKDMQLAFRKAATPNACIEVLEENDELKQRITGLETTNSELNYMLSEAQRIAEQAQKEKATLERERDAILQEAKVNECELNTQKGIIQGVRNVFDLRVYDFNLIPALKKALEQRDIEQQIEAIESLLVNPDCISVNGDFLRIKKVKAVLEQLRRDQEHG